jgi:hypothetical protein
VDAKLTACSDRAPWSHGIFHRAVPLPLRRSNCHVTSRLPPQVLSVEAGFSFAGPPLDGSGWDAMHSFLRVVGGGAAGSFSPSRQEKAPSMTRFVYRSSKLPSRGKIGC